MAKITSSKDLIVLLLYAKGHRGEHCEEIAGRTRLMKMVFLFDKEVRRKFNLEKVITAEAIPDFTPYDYGPFSSQVFSDLEFLVELGFVNVRQLDDENLIEESMHEYEYWQAGAPSNGPSKEEAFSLTDVGRRFVESEAIGRLSNEQWDALNEFKARCTAVPLRALLRYVYKKYDQMTTKSRIRDEILPEYPY